MLFPELEVSLPSILFSGYTGDARPLRTAHPGTLTLELFIKKLPLAFGTFRQEAETLDLLNLCVHHLIVEVFWTPVERVPILEPRGPNLLLRLSLVIGWRDQGHGS